MRMHTFWIIQRRVGESVNTAMGGDPSLWEAESPALNEKRARSLYSQMCSNSIQEHYRLVECKTIEERPAAALEGR